MACPTILRLLLEIVECGIDISSYLLGLRGIGLNNIDLSIIIVNYKSWGVLQQCLDSFQQFPPKLSHEIIVIDNDSQDGEFEVFGKNNLQIFAGINNNGLSATKEIYPFYSAYQNDTSFYLERGETFKVTPSFKYKPSTKFVWIEDFERSSISLESTPSSASKIDIIQFDIFEGFQSGKVSLDLTNPYTEILSDEKFRLERNGLKVYLELNFKGSQAFTVELWSNNVDGSIYKDNILGLIPVQDRWKKIYIELTEYVNRNTQAETYQIAFICNPTTISESTYFNIDNIKLLAF